MICSGFEQKPMQLIIWQCIFWQQILPCRNHNVSVYTFAWYEHVIQFEMEYFKLTLIFFLYNQRHFFANWKRRNVIQNFVCVAVFICTT